MKWLQEGTYVCFMLLILFKGIACASQQLSGDTPGAKWTCTCSSPDQVSLSTLTASNCSASCDCESSTSGWTCSCNHGRFPLLATDNNPNCFTTCTCISGEASAAVNAPREPISSKALVTLLAVCVVFALAFVISVVCFFRHKEKLQLPGFSSDEVSSSHNSGSNLIKHRPISFLESKFSICIPTFKSIAGCIKKVSFFIKSKSGRVHGTLIRFSYYELESATNKFSDSNLIGVGASSKVYRGCIEDGKTVAVKRIKTPSNYDADSVFLTEIELISRLHHCHVVPLIGYCSEVVGRKCERQLVFDYMPNGTLRECLDGSLGKYLDWKTRVSVALGAARGLEYLHDAAAPRILHRDVKSCNILLDENWRPKITDLGMAKQLRTDGFTSCTSSPARVQGTFGYFAPEYAIVGKASLKSDVFSFGVVLLELITGRKPIYVSNGDREESLATWAAPRLQNSRQVTMELPDPKLEGEFPEEEIQIMAYLAKECLLLDPDTRPSMSEVVQILSTLAPDMSKRRNFSFNLSQNLANDEADIRVEAEELMRAWSSRSPARLETGGLRKNADLTSSEYVRTLIHLSSSNRTCRVQQPEENVDITEPRFESFCMHNGELC